ncbi:hypothetical protein QR680_009367 [Steinernema hermaphroditum]|uniref:Uncharacterized protein n=1 Tax=Steinernema hermaphroditum TaxID=289476 RepID=A0AA39ILT8_9BILA|nr:hypothetical protein QR680_009367 [Steinernema hermaphroditum]
MLNSIFRPFGIFGQSVRYNCPWHRSNFRAYYFPFHMKNKLKTGTVEARQQSRGGRLMLMRRVLREQPFLGWNHDAKNQTKKLSYPL